MKLIALLIALLSFTAATNALTVDQVNALRKTLSNTPAPELGAAITKLIQDAAPADKAQVRAFALGWVAKTKPAALQTVTASLPPGVEENRPTNTPGNDNGNRPIIPPGADNYGKKHNYGKP